MTATEAEIAWAAGLFEGEGCIVITTATKTGHPRVGLSVNSTDRDVLERFALIVGYGDVKVCSTKRLPHHKQQYRWGVGTNQQTARILALLRPWFLERRAARADEALRTLAWSRTHCAQGHEKPLDQRGCRTCTPVWTRAEPRGPIPRDLPACKNGHERTADNTRLDLSGAVQCRDCERERSRRALLKRRATKGPVTA